MLVFGALSSVFDYLTFGVLLWLLHADQALFHTGWFVESVISAALVVFVLRTRLPVLRSRPSRLMAALTAGVVLITLALPYLAHCRPAGLQASAPTLPGDYRRDCGDVPGIGRTDQALVLPYLCRSMTSVLLS